MANRGPRQGGGGGNNGGGRRDFQRKDFDRNKNFGRNNLSPWQTGPGPGINNLFPLAGGSKEATLALASNIISSLLQPRPNPVPSLLDMPIRRDFGSNVGRYDRNPGPNRMGNQGNFRRSGNFNRSGDRGHNRRPFKANDGPRQQNKNSPRKEADPKAKGAKESTTGSDKQDENESAETAKTDAPNEPNIPKTRFDDINTQFLKCHICNKSMWDGRSFENHLSGRAHSIMMQKTVESYALAADTMRQEYKIRDMKRTRKTGQPMSRDFYCAMCDMYAADGAAHRTTLGHRKLKKYLHPSCTSCHKEMPTRIELDEHRLTPEHLRTLQEKSDFNSKPKPEVLVISTAEMEMNYLRDDRQRRLRKNDVRRQSKPATTGENAEVSTEDGVEIKQEIENENEEGGEKETAVEIEIAEPIDTDITITDYKEGDKLENFTWANMPLYSVDRGVGRSFLAEFKCYSCKLCKKLLDSEETAEIHLKTWRHHQLFTKMLQEKSGFKHDTHKRKLDKEGESPQKRAKMDGEEEQNGHTNDAENKDNEGDVEAAASHHEDEDLEDWEQSVDEILEDERYNPEEPNEDNDDVPNEDILNEEPAKEVVEETPEPVVKVEPVEEEQQVEEKVPEKEPSPPPVVTQPKTRGTPRGRARRGRRY